MLGLNAKLSSVSVQIVFVLLKLYLQFAYDFRLCDGHQVGVLNSESREGNDRQKAGVYLL